MWKNHLDAKNDPLRQLHKHRRRVIWGFAAGATGNVTNMGPFFGTRTGQIARAHIVAESLEAVN